MKCPLPWRTFASRIAAPFAVTRTLLLIAGFLALTQLVTRRDMIVFEIGPDGNAGTVHLSPSPSALSAGRHWAVNVFSRWDAEWYLRIAKHGYHFEPGIKSSTAFFPLYPAFMWVGSKLLGNSDATILLVGILTSNVSLLVALVYLIALVRVDFDEGVSRRTVLYVLVFPTTLFFSAAYSESLFFAAIVIAFYYARKARWLGAGLAGAVATLTRPPGFLIAAALLLEYLYQRNFRWQEIRPDIAALALIPLALTLYFGYFYWRFGNFFLFLESQKAWKRLDGTSLAVSFARLTAADLLLAALAAVLIAISWRWLRPSYALYATLAFLLPLASGSLYAMGRFCTTIFPIYIVLAIAGRKAAFDRYWVITSTALAVLSMALFSQGHSVD
jgi:Mannosyltransferase (PIG-V)